MMDTDLFLKNAVYCRLTSQQIIIDKPVNLHFITDTPIQSFF